MVDRRQPCAMPVLVGALLALKSGAAVAASVGPLVQITSGDPLTGCTADNARQQVKAGSVLYPATEIEPWVAADPSHPGRLIAGWQQDRWNDGGARGLLAGVSDDGGASWKTVRSGRVAKCEGGPWTRESDPWVDIGPGGVAYFIHLPFENNLPNGGSGPNAVSVTRSTNGGRTWEAPVTLVRETDPQATTDKESVTADPTNPSYAYAVWDLFIDYTIPPQAAAAGARPHDVVELTRERLRRLHAAGQAVEAPSKPQFAGPVYFSRTTDAGRTWEKARQIYDPGPNADTIGNIVEVLPNGTVVDFFDEADAKGVLRIKQLRSFDRGKTFEKKPTLVSVQVNGAFVGTVTPDKQELVRDANILFDVAVDPKSGTLYAVWQDTRFEAPVQAVMFAQSTDGGDHWKVSSGPVNKTPDDIKELRRQAFLPSIEVAADGSLVTTYYDFRNDGPNGELTDYWAAFCDPGKASCLNPDSWGGEVRLTNRSFDMLDAPDAGGHFLGDYMGLVRSGGAVIPVFGIADGKNRTSLYTRRITVGGRAEVAAAGQ